MKGINDKVFATFLIIVSLGLLLFGRQNTEKVAVVRAKVESVFVPILSVISEPIRAVDGSLEWGRRLVQTFNENDRLREENNLLRKTMIAASQVVVDNERLKELLNIREGEVQTVAASRVVTDTASPFFKSFLMNVGSEDGVKEGQAVVNEEGVVGRTIYVGQGAARVLLANDINSRIPVKFSRSGINAILAGNNGNLQRLLFLPDIIDVKVGDVILTSGQGSVFPPDLLIGHVSHIDAKGQVKVKLAANLYRLNYVSIINYEIAAFPLKNMEGAP